MADWEEVKRLAADFQKVQLSTTAQRLSERNCIEIISWLIEKKMIELIFTKDGKEYLTPDQLIQDILGELYVSGGRINLVELSKIIGVDLAHINNHLNEILRNHKDIHSILGQLIDATYITRIAGEINEKLSQQGQISVGDLTIQYDLPAEFLQQHVLEKNLGKVIHGKQDKSDPRVFFTESFIARSKAKIRGALAGITRPTSVSAILSRIDMTEKLFFTLFDQTSMYGSLTSKLVGAQYIPNVYARSQNEWVNNFYKQNGYLEYDALTRLGISDHKSYIKKQLGTENILYLNSCVISNSILERAQADVDECISSKSHIDLQSNLPSVFNESDIHLILDSVLIGPKLQLSIVIDNYVVSKAFMDNLSKCCLELVNTKAAEVVTSGKYQEYQTNLQIPKRLQKTDEVVEKVDKREERRKKAAGGKSGGGTQGRETKTKSTKKPGRSSKNIVDEDDYEMPEKKVTLEVVPREGVLSLILPTLESEGLDDVIEPIVDYLLPKLNEQGIQTAATIYSTTIADCTASRRQTHNDLQNYLNTEIGNVRLYEKGIKILPSDQQPALNKYLLKTLCRHIVNEILAYVASECKTKTFSFEFTNEQRMKFVNELPSEFKTSLVPLVKTLAGQSIDEFMAAVEEALSACGMIIKKIDKKKDRTVVMNHKREMLEKLNECDDLNTVLFYAVLVIFTTSTQCMLYASNWHLGSLLAYLKQFLNEEQFRELSHYHDSLMLPCEEGSEAATLKEKKLRDLMPMVKSIANEFKKPGSSSTEKS